MSIYNNIQDDLILAEFKGRILFICHPIYLKNYRLFEKNMRFNCAIAVFNFLNINSLTESREWSQFFLIALRYKIPVILVINPNKKKLIRELERIRRVMHKDENNESIMYLHFERELISIFSIEGEKSLNNEGNFIDIVKVCESLIEKDDHEDDDRNRNNHRLALASDWEETFKEFRAGKT